MKRPRPDKPLTCPWTAEINGHAVEMVMHPNRLVMVNVPRLGRTALYHYDRQTVELHRNVSCRPISEVEGDSLRALAESIDLEWQAKERMDR